MVELEVCQGLVRPLVCLRGQEHRHLRQGTTGRKRPRCNLDRSCHEIGMHPVARDAVDPSAQLPHSISDWHLPDRSSIDIITCAGGWHHISGDGRVHSREFICPTLCCRHSRIPGNGEEHKSCLIPAESTGCRKSRACYSYAANWTQLDLLWPRAITSCRSRASPLKSSL